MSAPFTGKTFHQQTSPAMNYLHGLSPDDSPDARATHEAGHLVMSWLLDRQPHACSLDDDGTGQPSIRGAKEETLHQRLLASLAGMVAEGNREVLGDLLDNLGNPDYFSRQSDAFATAVIAAMLDERERRDIVIGFILAGAELFQEYGETLRQAKELLLRDHEIVLETSSRLWQEWNQFHHLENRPKSDVVYRALARQLDWKLPEQCFIGWDLQPIRPR